MSFSMSGRSWNIVDMDISSINADHARQVKYFQIKRLMKRLFSLSLYDMANFLIP